MRILSGIQPSLLHIGNYLGALQQWVPLQNEHECFYCIVDLHALTSAYPMPVQELSIHTAALYLASGLDPNKATIFMQSAVPHHTYLFWLLTTKTPLGWLNRMTQFKSNVVKEASLGLYTYPALMAADILLYQANLVPVGEDQKQHLEFARDLAIRLNTLFNEELFTIPEPLIPKMGARIMSLKNGQEKMSKSDPAEGSRIVLNDTNDVIAKKIRRAKTDSLPMPEKPEDLNARPEMLNLFTLLAQVTNTNMETLCTTITSCGMLKEQLSDALISFLEPIRSSYETFMNDRASLEQLLDQGAQKARHATDDYFRRVCTTFLTR